MYAIRSYYEQLLLFPEDGAGARVESGPIPQEFATAAAVAREQLCEVAADWDDDLLATMLEGGAVPVESYNFV